MASRVWMASSVEGPRRMRGYDITFIDKEFNMSGKHTSTTATGRLRRVLLAVSLGALCATSASASVVQAPAGYDAYLTYIQNGVFDPASPHPVIPGCGGGICDGNYFHSAYMKRNPAQVAALETQAKAFFKRRFGIDVDNPANAGRVVLQRFTLDPRTSYRAYVISGVPVPPEGFAVNDGGFMLAVTDPNGYTLTSGEFIGQKIPAGGFMILGEYQIEVKRGNRIVETIEISYRSGSFVSRDANGVGHFACEIKRGRLEVSGFANLSVPREGLAQGIIGESAVLGGGKIKANVRTALTFGGIGGI